MSTKITDKNRIPELVKQMRSLKHRKIEMGIIAPSGDKMYMIAWVHEFGINIGVTDKMRGWFLGQGMPLKKTTTHITIPERSYLRTGYDANKGSIDAQVNKAIEGVLQGDKTAYEAREQVGEFASKKIKSNVSGVGLVKTGALKNAIGFRVVTK